MLCYLLGWVSGMAFLLGDRRPFVRYHAAQSVAVFGALTVVLLVVGDFLLATFLPSAGSVLLLARRLVELLWIVAAVVLMLKANAGERVRVGLAARFAERAERSGK